MYAVRRVVLAWTAGLLLVLTAGCGGSITDVTPRTNPSSAVRAVTPFCEAVEESEVASEPVSRLQAGQRVDDVAAVADRVRAANQQVIALAPQEIRADFDRLSAVTDRRLRLLEENGGDTLALARDPDVTREASDPEYRAANRRVQDYVRRTC